MSDCFAIQKPKSPGTECLCGRCAGIPAQLVIFVAQAYFLAALDPFTPLVAAGVAGLVNLAGDLAMVNWLGYGISGAAWATSAAQVMLWWTPFLSLLLMNV